MLYFFHHNILYKFEKGLDSYMYIWVALGLHLYNVIRGKKSNTYQKKHITSRKHKEVRGEYAGGQNSTQECSVLWHVGSLLMYIWSIVPPRLCVGAVTYWMKLWCCIMWRSLVCVLFLVSKCTLKSPHSIVGTK